jgi:glycosyltransferase involved in cell wall biosynthesis
MSLIKVVFYDEGAQGETQLGGGQLARLSLMENINKTKFKPILLTSKDSELAKEARNRGITVYIEPIIKGIPRFSRHILFRNPILLLLLLINGARAGWILAKTLKKLEANILHPNENLSRTITIFSKMWHHIPIITHVDGEWNKGLTDRLMRKIFTKYYTRLIAVSKRIQLLFSNETHKNKVTLIYEGIDISRFHNLDKGKIRRELGVRDNTFILGTVGKLVDIKGQHLVLNALAELEYPEPYIYVLIGNGPARKNLEQLVREKGLEKNVKFFGFRTDVPSLMSGMDCLVHPSLTEAFPLTIIEGAFAGLPIIATNVGGTSEIIEDGQTGWLVEPGIVDVLINPLVEVAQMNANERFLLGSELREKVIRKYSLENCIQETELVYLELLTEVESKK